MKILLLDMDGVLLEPHGYHSALVETVQLIGRSLGFDAVRLTPQEIAAFESAGVFSEWDSSAICVVLLLQEMWKTNPELRLPQTIKDGYPPTAGFQRPDFAGFARRLALETDNSLLPLDRASLLLLDHSHHTLASQGETIRQILESARALPGSLTHRTFQELVLGSRAFAEAYAAPPLLNTGSYLLKFDLPLINENTRLALLTWLDAERRAAIMTSRPSEPLPGAFSTPEAELGARLLQLEDLPIVGLGGLSWLARQTGAPSQFYLKPRPVHALAALARAAGLPLDESLLLAASLADGHAGAFWQHFEAAEICVFEDSTAGLKSAQGAVQLLARAGISTRLALYGITQDDAKAAALRSQGATVYPTINVALRQAKVS